MNRCIIYLQRRAHKAGAQSALARLLKHPAAVPWNPVLVCSETGWLTRELEKSGVRVLVQPFPSSRSLAGRLWLNHAFALSVRRRLMEENLVPVLVHANDHAESLLALALSKICKMPSVLHLRSGGMTRSDWEKYACSRHAHIIAVGDELKQRAQAWHPSGTIHCIYDGLAGDEFAPPKPRPAVFPGRLLVLGSPDAGKGWSDLVEALAQLDNETLPPMEFHFPADDSEKTRKIFTRQFASRFSFRFLGRIENFQEALRQYDLAINPSRFESFGLAALETLAQGVPLVSSRVGVIERVIKQPEYLFAPGQPADMANALRRLVKNWAALPFDTTGCQQRIRELFLIDRTWKELNLIYADTLGPTS